MPSITATVLPFSQVGRVGKSQSPQKFSTQHHQNCACLRNISTQKDLEASLQRSKSQKYKEKLPGLTEEYSQDDKKKDSLAKKADICTKFYKESISLLNKQQRIPIRASKEILSGK